MIKKDAAHDTTRLFLHNNIEISKKCIMKIKQFVDVAEDSIDIHSGDNL